MDLRPDVAEAVGTFFLVLAGGAAILSGGSALAVAVAFGFAVAALVHALGHVSGAHFNPAITVAFATTRHFPWRRVPGYLVAQVAGAVLASLVLRWVFGSVRGVTTHVAPDLGVAAAFAVEVLATAMLALVILAVATDRRASSAVAGIAIGFTVAVGSLWAGGLTNASMNPARSLGPALVAGVWSSLWLYLTAPLAGAVLGMATYEWMRAGSRPSAPDTLGALGPVDGTK